MMRTGVSPQKRIRYFYQFSSASNLRSLQAAYLTFAEYVYLLVDIILAKNYRTKDSEYTGCTKMEKYVFF